MASGSQTASAIRRLRSNAGSRLTEGLLSSNSKVAAIGLITAVLTLTFTIWFRVVLGYHGHVSAPMTRAASELDTAVNQSLAALRGWVAYGDPESIDERAESWSDGIEPSIAMLHELAPRTDDLRMGEQIAALGRDLRDLERTQWAIEDVARTPGNEPASVEYAARLEPLRRSVLASVGDAMAQYGADRDQERSIDFLGVLAQFRAAFTESDLVLNELLSDYSEVRAHEIGERLARARTLAVELQRDAAGHTSGDLRHLLTFALAEFRAYELQIPEIVALRRSAAWNVAQQLYVEEAQPLALRARALSRELAATQAASTAARAQRLARASYVVIAMALLMGLLSLASLFVSFRLRRQVKRVMDKAKMLGQYALERRIGKGAMGEVYLAHHAMLHRPAAVKLLRAASAQSAHAQNRFRREVQLSSQLTHPNTIEIFDYGRTVEGIFYYAMEYLDGFTLQSLVAATGPVPPARVVHILVQACGSLQEAHTKALLHRDVKPSNIMLTERGGLFDTVKILDFGLVKELVESGEEGVSEGDIIAGTPMYLAPESILAADAATPASDIYALGAVGYYLLTGTTVFPSDDVVGVFDRQVNEQPEGLSERLGRTLPGDLEAVVLACLAKDATERPRSAAALAAMLRACECGAWTSVDAKSWWTEFGEAVKSAAAPDVGDSQDPAARSGLEIELGSTGA